VATAGILASIRRDRPPHRRGLRPGRRAGDPHPTRHSQ